MANLPEIERFDSNTGVRIYRLPMEAFPQFIVYAYLLLDGNQPTLVDCGSNLDKSQSDLLAAIESVHDDFGESVRVGDIQRILITHGHIDHHGGLNFIHEQTQAAIGIHALDRRILTAYEERVVVTTKNLRIYLQRAGVSDKSITNLMEVYNFAKRDIKSEQVDFLLDEAHPLDGYQFIHTPGHCSGQVCIRIGDVLLTADHILSRTTPHQAPESITHFTGLGHFMESLDKIGQVDGIRLALGGHEAPIDNFYARVQEIADSHHSKLERFLQIIRDSEQPVTIADISKRMYPTVQGYNILLALEETGAHVEYLYEHGQLAVNNLDEVERDDNPALKYCVV